MASPSLQTSNTGATAADRVYTSLIEPGFKVLAAGIGLAYGAGFLVVLTFLNEYGIRESGGDLFKLRYIYVGMLCLACPTALVCVVHGLLSDSQRIPNDAPALTLRHFVTRLFTPAENMPLVLIVMLLNLSVVFYCIIAFAPPGLFIAKQSLINWLYLPLLATLVLRLIFGVETLWSRRLNLFRWALTVVAITTAIAILKDIDFRAMVKDRIHNYLVLQALFFFFVYRFTKWPLLGSDTKQRTSRLLVRFVVLGSLFLLGVFSFAHTVYSHIPAEKGGGDFSLTSDSQVCFPEAHRMSIPAGLVGESSGQPLCTVPVKLIEENATDIYVARSSDRGNYSETEVPNPAALWRSGKYYPVVFEISRSVISSVIIFNRRATQLVRASSTPSLSPDSNTRQASVECDENSQQSRHPRPTSNVKSNKHVSEKIR